MRCTHQGVLWSFFQGTHKRYPIARPRERVWVNYCEFKFWTRLYRCDCRCIRKISWCIVRWYIDSRHHLEHQKNNLLKQKIGLMCSTVWIVGIDTFSENLFNLTFVKIFTPQNVVIWVWSRPNHWQLDCLVDNLFKLTTLIWPKPHTTGGSLSDVNE